MGFGSFLSHAAAPLGQIAGGLLGIGGQNPGNQAMRYINGAPAQLSPYYQPYIQTGQRALPQLEQQYGELMKNPQSIMNMLGGGFHQSPGYQFQYDQAMQGANNAAAAGGMAGSPSHQQSAAMLAGNVANQDFYNYLSHIMNLYQMGVGGLGGLNSQGFQASTGMADNLGGIIGSQANLAYAGGANRASQFGGGLGGILGGIGGLASLF